MWNEHPSSTNSGLFTTAGSCQEKHPPRWTACEWIQPWGTVQQLETFCPPWQSKLGCLAPLCPRNEPSGRQRMELSSAQPRLDHGSWSQRSQAAVPSKPFYEQHLIIRPFKTLCIINLEWSRGR